VWLSSLNHVLEDRKNEIMNKAKIWKVWELWITWRKLWGRYSTRVEESTQD